MTGDPPARVLVGTCSWTDRTLVESDAFYPSRRLSAEERLAFYASRFPVVEVDSTYYAPPSEKLAGLWVERTPPQFVFDVKAFRLLTGHPTPPSSLWKDIREELPAKLAGKRNVYLRDLPPAVAEEAFERFRSALMPLYSAGKLGLVLFQLPPYVYPSRRSFFELDRAAGLLGDVELAVEVRNARWLDDRHRDETLRFLAERRMTYVCVDEPQGFASSVPPVTAVTAPVAEVRFHGRNAATWEARNITAAERFAYDYRTDELAEWVPRVGELAAAAESVHVLMNNCYSDYAVRSAAAISRLLADAGVGSGIPGA